MFHFSTLSIIFEKIRFQPDSNPKSINRNINKPIIMKFSNLFLWIIITAFVSLASCKSKKEAVKYDPPIATPQKTEEIVAEEPTPEPEPVQETSKTVEPAYKPVPVKEEKVAIANKPDANMHENKKFFVIMGSFRSADNANSLKNTLTQMGFKPFILISETGLNRVAVESYNDEDEAIRSVLNIRSSYPNYKDTWLLRKK